MEDGPENKLLLVDLLNHEDWSECISLFKNDVQKYVPCDDPTYEPSTIWGKLIMKILKTRRVILDGGWVDPNVEIRMDILEESDARLDYLIAVLINYHYILSKKSKSGVNSLLYFHLFTVHREYGHRECKDVLTAICLKLLVNHGAVKVPACFDLNDIVSHQGICYFYAGYISLLSENYEDAFSLLRYSSIVRPNARTEACILIVSLFLGMPYKQKRVKRMMPYNELKKAVESGDMLKYRDTVSRYEDLYRADGLINPLARLSIKIEKHKYNKISKIYCRISKDDLERAGVDVSKIVSQDGVITFSGDKKQFYDIKSRIDECNDLINRMKLRMTFKKSEPLCYETVVKNLEKD